MKLYTVKNLVSLDGCNMLAKRTKEVKFPYWSMNRNSPTHHFTADELNNLEPKLRSFVCSDFCRVTEVKTNGI
ncbi:hypothetical protein [Salinicoccus roseus]|uniref:Uncharacterized protein n=1 Tax=Salinicoccus roseus TaxID=45670 RepID=A0A0C2HK27_9STAP|nr:hypothetical protein [Salinicoccus roseus]KIH69926.1 hypothetical protein SN16_10440 [Salinicoccus roseus]MDB0581216.1 hypothetical protein [Salinicoccus roseus]